MNKNIFYDTDCLSCFISINDVSILKKLFDKVIIPNEVYEEFKKVNILKKRVDKLIGEDFIEVIDFDINSEVYKLYAKLHRGYLFDREIGKVKQQHLPLQLKIKE